MIGDPVVRLLLIGAIPLLLLIAWGCFRAHLLQTGPLSALIARLRGRSY